MPFLHTVQFVEGTGSILEGVQSGFFMYIIKPVQPLVVCMYNMKYYSLSLTSACMH